VKWLQLSGGLQIICARQAHDLESERWRQTLHIFLDLLFDVQTECEVITGTTQGFERPNVNLRMKPYI